MEKKTVNISKPLHKEVKKLSANSGEPVYKVIEKAVAKYVSELR